MGYTNNMEKIKGWELNNKKLRYCSSAKFDEQKIKLEKYGQMVLN